MTTQELVANLIIFLLPFTIVAASLLFQIVIHALPERQRAALVEFARMAVQRTEQLYSELPGGQKKEAATLLVRQLFNAFHLPVPAPILVDAAIESAVFTLNRVAGVSGQDENPFAYEAPPTTLADPALKLPSPSSAQKEQGGQ